MTDLVDLQMDLGGGHRLSSLTALALARRFSINNIPRKSASGEYESIDNLKRLVKYVIVPLKEEFGDDFQIISGYQSPETHEALGISLTSHARGRALDFRVFKTPYPVIVGAVKALNIPFDTLVIKEHYALIHHIPWVHIAIPEKHEDPRFRLLEYSSGRYRPISS